MLRFVNKQSPLSAQSIVGGIVVTFLGGLALMVVEGDEDRSSAERAQTVQVDNSVRNIDNRQIVTTNRLIAREELRRENAEKVAGSYIGRVGGRASVVTIVEPEEGWPYLLLLRYDSTYDDKALFAESVEWKDGEWKATWSLELSADNFNRHGSWEKHERHSARGRQQFYILSGCHRNGCDHRSYVIFDTARVNGASLELIGIFPDQWVPSAGYVDLHPLGRQLLADDLLEDGYIEVYEFLHLMDKIPVGDPLVYSWWRLHEDFKFRNLRSCPEGHLCSVKTFDFDQDEELEDFGWIGRHTDEVAPDSYEDFGPPPAFYFQDEEHVGSLPLSPEMEESHDWRSLYDTFYWRSGVHGNLLIVVQWMEVEGTWARGTPFEVCPMQSFVAYRLEGASPAEAVPVQSANAKGEVEVEITRRCHDYGLFWGSY